MRFVELDRLTRLSGFNSSDPVPSCKSCLICSAVTVQHPRIPVCTYRLQFNRWFTFVQTREIVPYLHALGVSDVYASPYFQASPESKYGDITDCTSQRGDRFAGKSTIHSPRNCVQGMGQILDFVPNHMGVCRRGTWWMDVLENGPSSMYALYFDIDWHPLKSDLRDKVLLPILTDQYGRVSSVANLKSISKKAPFSRVS